MAPSRRPRRPPPHSGFHRNGSDHDDHDVDQDQSLTEMGYQVIVNGLFRALAQQANIPVDFIDETDLTDEGLKPYSALIITEPDVPRVGQEAVLRWVHAGGGLLTASGAMANDECVALGSAGRRTGQRPCTMLAATPPLARADACS